MTPQSGSLAKFWKIIGQSISGRQNFDTVEVSGSNPLLPSVSFSTYGEIWERRTSGWEE